MSDITRLRYQITPSEGAYTSPPQAVTFQIIVTNPSDDPVACSAIQFEVPIGDDGTALTSDPGFGVVTAGAQRWSARSEGDGVIVAVPASQRVEIPGRGQVSLLLQDVWVVPITGSASIGVTEYTDQKRSTTIDVRRTQARLAITQFSASPIEVPPGEKTTLAWATAGATQCTLTPHNPSIVDPNGSVDVAPDRTTTYTLTAEGGGETVHQQLTVTVDDVDIIEFDATPRNLTWGESTRFRWRVLFADTCMLTPFDERVDPVIGTLDRPITQSGDYRLEARANGRLVEKAVHLTVEPVEVHLFDADPPVVSPGGATTLRWDTAWAAARTIQPGIGTVAANGRAPLTPSATTIYELAAEGRDTIIARTPVVVGPVIVDFVLDADPNDPRTVFVSWEVQGGAADLAMWWGSETPSFKPVDANGRTTMTLRDEGLSHVELRGIGGTARARLDVAGPIRSTNAGLNTLRFSDRHGLATGFSNLCVDWTSSGLSNVLVDVQQPGGPRQSSRLPSGEIRVPLGPAVPGAKQWSGGFDASFANGAVGIAWTVW